MQPVWRMRYYPAVGPAIPHKSVGRSRVTHPFAGHLLRGCPRLACVKHAASVRPEPGSNSPREEFEIAHRTRPSSSPKRSRRCVRITVDCRSNSPQHPDRDAGSKSPPARLRSQPQLSNSTQLYQSEPHSAAALQSSSGLRASQPARSRNLPCGPSLRRHRTSLRQRRPRRAVDRLPLETPPEGSAKRTLTLTGPIGRRKLSYGGLGFGVWGANTQGRLRL